MRVIPKKTSKFTNLIIEHIKDNVKSYLIVSLILLIGIILGVIFINNMNETQCKDVQSYLTEFTNSLKEGSKIDTGKLFQKLIGSNLLLAFIMWFVGSTVIGIPIVLGIVLFRGFCLGYTISASIAVFGTGKGILFFLSSTLLQNIVFIPCIIAMAVSGMKLYKAIIKDKRKENIKFEIFKHTIFSLIILAFLMLSAVIEAYMSSNLLMLCASYL